MQGILKIYFLPCVQIIFSIVDRMDHDFERRFWIAYPEAKEDTCVIKEDLEQEGMVVKIVFPMSHNVLTIVEEYGPGRVCT